MVLAEVIDPNYQLETVLKLHNGSKEKYVSNIDDPLRHLVLPCL